MESKTEFQEEEKDKNLPTGLLLKDESINKKKKKRKNRKRKAVEILELQENGKEESLQTDSLLETESNQKKKKISDEEEVKEGNLLPQSESNKKKKKRKNKRSKSALPRDSVPPEYDAQNSDGAATPVNEQNSSDLVINDSEHDNNSDTVTNGHEHDSSDPVTNEYDSRDPVYANVKEDDTGKQVTLGSDDKNKQNDEKSVPSGHDELIIADKETLELPGENPATVKHAEISDEDSISLEHDELDSADLATFELIGRDHPVTLDNDEMISPDLATFEVIDELSNEDTTSDHDELTSAAPPSSELISERLAASEHNKFPGEGSITNEDSEPFVKSPITPDLNEPATEGQVTFECDELTTSALVSPKLISEGPENFESNELSGGNSTLPAHLSEGTNISKLGELTRRDKLTIECEHNELSGGDPFAHSLGEQSDIKLIDEKTVSDKEHMTDSDILVPGGKPYLDEISSISLGDEGHLSSPLHTATDFKTQGNGSSSEEVTLLTTPDIFVSDETPHLDEISSISLRGEDNLSSPSHTATEIKTKDSRSSIEEVMPLTTPDILVSNKTPHLDEISSVIFRDVDHPSSPSDTTTDIKMHYNRSSPLTSPDILVFNKAPHLDEISSISFRGEDHPSSLFYTSTGIKTQYSRSFIDEVIPLTTPDIIVSDETSHLGEISSISLSDEDHSSSLSHTATDVKKQYSRSFSEEVMQLATPDIVVSNKTPRLDEISSISLRDVGHLSSPSNKAADIETQYSGPSSSEEVIPSTTPDILVPDETPHDDEASGISVRDKNHSSSLSHTATNETQHSGPSTSGKIIPLKRSKTIPKSVGFFYMFCFLIIFHAFCALFSVLKKIFCFKQTNVPKINSGEAHSSSRQR